MNRPVTLVCYICGRQFGTKSLAIHVKACEKKWENEQSLKPPKQRRPCPRPPKGFDQLVSKQKITKQDINKFNTKSFDAFVEQALVQCEYCGRRFNQKSLVPHQKACKINPMIKKPYVSKGPLGKIPEQNQPIKQASMGYNFKAQQEDYNQNANLIPCRKCDRKFLPDRVGKHEKVCKGERVQIKKQAKFTPPPQQQISKMKPNFQKEKKPKWKVQHEQFQNALKSMKQMKAIQAKGGKLSDLPPPPRSNYDHYVECKYCGRKYAPDVAERHIPKCANIINKPGGIKPSKIQQKYIGGTGSGSNKNTSNYGNTPIKPNSNIASNTSGTYNLYKNSETNPSSYGNPSKLQKPNVVNPNIVSYNANGSLNKPNFKTQNRKY